MSEGTAKVRHELDAMAWDGGAMRPEQVDPDECIYTPEMIAETNAIWQSLLATASPEVQRFFTPATHPAAHVDEALAKA